MSRQNGDIVIREGVSTAIMIILYGVPVVLMILTVILIGLGVRYGMQKYRAKQETLTDEPHDEGEMETIADEIHSTET